MSTRHRSCVVVSVSTLLAAAGAAMAGDKSWTGAGDNRNWFLGSNWSDGIAPGADDDVTIPNTGQGFVLLDFRVNATVKSLIAEVPVELGGGTLDLAGPATFNAGLKLSSGTLTGAGDATLQGANTWRSATVAGTGRLIIGPGATMDCNFAITRNVTRPIENHGLLLLSVGAIAPASGTVWTNAADGTIRMASSFQIVRPSETSWLFNEGALVAEGTSMLVGQRVENSGTVRVLAGTLALSWGGTHTGAFMVEPGTTLALRQGHTLLASATLAGGGDVIITGTGEFSTGFQPTGRVSLEAGSVSTFRGSFTPARMQIAGGATATLDADQVWQKLECGGTLGGDGDVTLTGPDSTMTGATLSGSGTLTIAQGAGLRMFGSFGRTVRRSIHNAGTFQIQGGTLTAYSITFTNAPGAVFDMDAAQWGDASQVPPSLIENQGSIRIGGGSGASGRIATRIVNSGSIHAAGSNVDIMSGGVHTGLVTYTEGTRLMLGGGHTFEAGSSLSGAGQLVLSVGVQRVDGALDATGPVTVSGGGSAIFNTPLDPSSLTISSGATAQVNAPSTLRGLMIDSGTLTSNAEVTLGTDAEWRTGTMNGAARVVIPPGLTLALTSPVSRTFTGRIWNEGAISLRQASISMSGNARIDNRPGARIELLANTFISGGPAQLLANEGEIAFVGQNTGSSISAMLDNRGWVTTDGVRVVFNGVVAQYSAGVLSGGGWSARNAGSFAMPGSALIRENRGTVVLSGETTRMPGLAGLTTQRGTLELRDGQNLAATPLGGTLVNHGRLLVDQGSRLSVTGASSQSPAGSYESILGGGGQCGRIVASGALSLGGGLQATLAAGQPLDCGESYELLTGASVAGEFETLSLPSAPSRPTVVQVHGGSFVMEVCPCPADFNRDGGVDGSDVEEFFSMWETGQTPADVNYDGGVDGADAERFFEAWEAGGCQ